MSIERKILPQCQGELVKASRIACCPNADIIIGRTQAYVLGPDGIGKVQLTQYQGDTEKQVQGVAVSSDGHIFVVDKSKFVKTFSLEGKYIRSFSTLTEDEDPNTEVALRCVTIDRAGRILVGDEDRQIITVHSCPDGRVIEKVKCIMKGYGSITVNSKEQILHHGSVHSKVVAIDYSGIEAFTFSSRSRIDEDVTGKEVIPRGIVCDANDNIYIVFKVFSYGCIMPFTGHLHKYSPTGAFLKCLAKGLHNPCGLCLTPDGSSLLVANIDSILVFSIK